MSIVDFLWNLGPWNWFILAVILFLLETIVPGVHFIWFGLAAFIVGALSFVRWRPPQSSVRSRASPRLRPKPSVAADKAQRHRAAQRGAAFPGFEQANGNWVHKTS